MSDIIVILDESGSMECMGSEPVQALNDFIKKQQEVEGVALFSLYTFSVEIRKVYVDVPLKEIKNYDDYHPKTYTALFDCISTAISDKMKTSRTEDVVLVIITDGMDNASKHATKEETKQKIKEQEEKHNWSVMYLGANQDAFSSGQDLGIRRGNTAGFDQRVSGNFCQAVREMSACVSATREASAKRQ